MLCFSFPSLCVSVAMSEEKSASNAFATKAENILRIFDASIHRPTHAMNVGHAKKQDNICEHTDGTKRKTYNNIRFRTKHIGHGKHTHSPSFI